MENDDNKNSQSEQPELNNKTQENTESNKRMAQTSLKSAATAAGAYLGGSTGAKIGSKAADVINNSKIGNAVTDAAAQAGNVANKISPTGDTNQKLTNAAADSGLLDIADKAIDTAASNGSGSSQSHQQSRNTPKNDIATKSDNLNNINNTQTAKNSGDNNKINIDVEGIKRNVKSSSSKQRENDKYDRASRKHFSNNYTQEEDLEEEKNESEDSENKTDKKKKNKGFINQLKNITKAVPVLAGILGVIGNFIITNLSIISTFLIVSIVVSLIASLVSLIGNIFIYSQDDDGNTCYISPTCTSVNITLNNEEKKLELADYIAGIIVNYYDYNDFKNTDGNVSDEFIKAMAVIIHSDISAFSDYDYTTETCKAIQTNKFLNVYITDSSNIDVDENKDQASDANNESEVETEDENNQTDISNEEKEKVAYYNQAKNDVNQVLDEVVDIYNSHFNLFFDNYKGILNYAISAGYDYKEIIREYLKNDPYYNDLNLETTEDDESDKDGIGVYPICDFKKKDSNNGNTGDNNYSYIIGDFCSQVEVNDQMYKGTYNGIYPLETFIEGVVLNEAGHWSNSIDTLKAHAVAARTWLYNSVNTNFKGFYKDGDTCHAEITKSTLGFKNATSSAVSQAVRETAGEYIVSNGKIVSDARWDALAIKDGYYQNKDSSYYTLKQKNQKIPKDWLNKQTLFMSIPDYIVASHGGGMSQYGAYYLATVEGKNYQEIIKYYYDADVGRTVGDYIMPINTFSRISGEVNDRCKNPYVFEKHRGIDFAAAAGTPVYAAHSGTVSKLDPGDTKEGIGVAINNGDGTTSYYFHFSKRENLVEGQKVEIGQKIGEVGSTGGSTGNHLHYQMLKTGTNDVVQSRDYLPLDEKGYTWCYGSRKQKK